MKSKRFWRWIVFIPPFVVLIGIIRGVESWKLGVAVLCWAAVIVAALIATSGNNQNE